MTRPSRPPARPAAVPYTIHSLPLGTSLLPDGSGLDLAKYGYLEEEFLVSGVACEWTYEHLGGPAVVRTADVPFTTRVLVRRPSDPAGFNGVLQVEPLHPNLDSAYTWRAIHPWIMRTGGAWVGVTQDAGSAAMMRDTFDRQRYGALDIPIAGLGHDIVGSVVTAIRSGECDVLGRSGPVVRAYLSGWSITGTFCRVFVEDGFADRHRQADGSPIVDGYVIAISSGGGGPWGYAPLSTGTQPPALDDPRRRPGRHGVPIIELLSELESETHAAMTRPDSDAPGDPYRLYQIAGTSHACGIESVLTNQTQYRARGVVADEAPIIESRSDARMDVMARAVFANLDRWVGEGQPPPTAGRFSVRPEELPDSTHPVPAHPLHRDEDGNVTGGLRTPWIDVPVARYQPHGKPDLAKYRPSATYGHFGPQQQAALVGTMELFSAVRLGELYGRRAQYLSQFEASCARLVGEGHLLLEDVAELIEQATERELPLP